jgi:hypothetical protein
MQPLSVSNTSMGSIARIRWSIVLPVGAGLMFMTLCLAATRQSGIVDWGRWGSSVENPSGWATEPTDIGVPADILLLAFNLPALMALLPLLPLTYWIGSEFILRGAWGLAALGQWFLIGRYFDIRHGHVSEGNPKLPTWLRKVLFSVIMAGGALALGMGLYSLVGHSTVWGIGMVASFIIWGFVLLIFALRWRASASWDSDHLNFLRLS